MGEDPSPPMFAWWGRLFTPAMYAWYRRGPLHPLCMLEGWDSSPLCMLTGGVHPYYMGAELFVTILLLMSETRRKIFLNIPFIRGCKIRFQHEQLG